MTNKPINSDALPAGFTSGWRRLSAPLDVRIITNELFMKTKANIDKESQKRILELSNEELIKVAFIESPKYREEFVEFAKAEVKKRG